MTAIIQRMYVLYGVNDLEYYVSSRGNRIQRWLLRDKLPGSSYDSVKVIPNVPGESIYDSLTPSSRTDYYHDFMESKVKEACNTDDAQFVYSKYTYNMAPVAAAAALPIVIPPRRNRVNLGRLAGVGPHKKFNALRMFKQFAKQHSSEIQSSSSAKFQTKKRKAPQTKKTKRRRK